MNFDPKKAAAADKVHRYIQVAVMLGYELDTRCEEDGSPYVEYWTRIKDIQATAMILARLLEKHGVHGTDEVDAIISVEKTAKRMARKFRNDDTYRLSQDEVYACLDFHIPPETLKKTRKELA